MPRYRRDFVPGGTYFFTLTLTDRRSRLLIDEVDRLRSVYRRVQARHPFRTLAICVLPDHVHAVWALPDGDADFPLRWRLIKSGFSRTLPVPAGRRASLIGRREKGIWQRRYWEHRIRDEADLERHVAYVHFNPVKHGLVRRVRDWPWSSFHRHVAAGWLPEDWAGGEIDAGACYGE
ncbi:MAG: transposase [Chromatiales bacterium]|jgi:putative transposase|nr:transposase [Chromatiales bacterium]MDX9768442.1 transposase [Ectothiorhodospiraceae bacterium]